METTRPLLFRLNIPLDFYEHLKDFYYIPEVHIEHLKPGGKIIGIDRYRYPKRIFEMGSLKSVDTTQRVLCCSRRPFSGVHIEAYHIFYEPKMDRTTRAMISLQNSLSIKN